MNRQGTTGEAALRNIDFSSWQSVLATLTGLALITLIGVGIRLLVMSTVQQRRERANRQINERLKTLIAAYKILGGSFTGTLSVDPTHMRDLRRRGASPATADPAAAVMSSIGSDRSRRIRDAVEAALSDVILLGTEEQVNLAAHAVSELVAGRPVHTHDLVVSLRNFIRSALDLEPIPASLQLPQQGPARPSAVSGKGKGEQERDGARKGDGGAIGMGGGTGMGLGEAGGQEDLFQREK